MNKYKILYFIILASATCILSGCGKETIVGNWVSSDSKYSIAFDENGAVVIDGAYMGQYSLYDEGKIAINVDTATFDEVYDVNMTAEYKIQDGMIQITDLDNSEIYIYYSEKKVSKLVNDEYLKKRELNPSEQYMPIILSYPDKWELYLEGTELEGVVDKKTLVKDAERAKELVEKEILPLYFDGFIDVDKQFRYGCENAVYVWDKVCYSIFVNCEYEPDFNCTYVVNPDTKDIYISDDEGILSIWDGKIKGKTMLKEI